MKNLIVKYTPREGSNTQKLLEIFQEKIKDEKIITRDLVKNSPPLLLKDNLNSYVKRKQDQELSEEDLENLKEMDILTKEFVDADRIIIAYPIYNYSMPAAVKAWFDSIVQKGFTFSLESEDKKNKLENKKIIVINTSGSTQFESSSDLSTPLVKRIFTLMGIRDIIFIGTMAISYTGFNDEIVKKFEEEVELD